MYASGAEGVTLRVALAYAARYATWRGLTIDVKSAFLYAPIGAEAKGRDERIVVKPPAFLTELGILKPSDRWWVKKALYGLPTSPRDWGNYRDQEFRAFELQVDECVYVLCQLKADESLWFLRSKGPEGLGASVGLLVVYVDDLAFFADEKICQAFIETVQKKWKTSPPTWFGKEPVTFCGVEIVQTGRGYRLSQTAYLRELLQRFQVTTTSLVPITKWVEPEIKGEPELWEVREAQAITGALLWISTRSRPDISFAVSKMGQLATKVPKVTIELGYQVLAYLQSTVSLSVEFLYDTGAYFSDHGNLNLPRTDSTIEIYSDASHSPGGERSTQCVFILWRGSPIVWESCRQSFTTLSSAESELVGMVHSIQLAESLQPLIDELLSDDSTLSLLGDNSAAVRAFDQVGSGWRNRHLRMRAVAGRERVEAGLLKVAHLPGEFQVADLGTKPLARGRMLQLLELVNVRSAVDAQDAVKTARMLSRLSLTGISSVPVTAEALAGLALIAALPTAQAQPGWSEVGPGSSLSVWIMKWVMVGLVLLGLGVWWWLASGKAQLREELEASPRFLKDVPVQGESETLPQSSSGDAQVPGESETLPQSSSGDAQVPGESETLPQSSSGDAQVPRESETLPQSSSGDAQVPGESQASSQSGPGEGVQDPVLTSGSSGDFNEEEWAQAEAKLRAVELETGLTFLQRAKLRRQLRAGGVVDVPVFQQRYGPLPPWMMRGDACKEELPGVGRVGVSEVAGLLTTCGGLLVAMLGSLAVEWGELRSCCRGLNRNAALTLIRRVPVTLPQTIRVSAGQDGGSSGASSSSHQPRSLTAQPSGLTGLGSSEVQPVDMSRSFRDDGSSVEEADQASGEEGSDESETVGSLESEREPHAATPDVGQVGDPWEQCYEDVVEPVEVSTFPIVGTWLRLHYLVQLLSTAGELILSFLGERSAAWGELRCASLMIRTGLIGAVATALRRGPRALEFEGPAWYEAVDRWIAIGWLGGSRSGAIPGPLFPTAPCPPGVPTEDVLAPNELTGEEVDRDDDPVIDELPPRGADRQFPAMPFGPAAEALLDGESSTSGDSTSTEEPSVGEATTGSPSVRVVNPEGVEGSETGTVTRGLVGGVVYEAAQGALLVHYSGEVLAVPLEGWSLEDVEEIVRALRTGDWSEFARRVSEGVSSDGAPGSSTDPPCQVGIRGRFFKGLWRLVEGCRGILWSLIVLWILVQSVRAQEFPVVLHEFPVASVCDSPSSLSLVNSGEAANPRSRSGCDGSTMWEIFKVLFWIGTWEVGRRFVVSRTRSHRGRVERSSQTYEWSVVGLPLRRGIPNRDKILFSLWLAGYQVDADSSEYSDRVRSGFHELIGGYLCRLEREGEGYSDSLSETSEEEPAPATE